MFNKRKKNNSADDSPFLRKGDKLVVLGDKRTCFKVMRECSDRQKELLDTSTLVFSHGSQIFSHYFIKDLPEDRSDPEWKNKAIFFWNSNEPFPGKSLPPHFSNMEQRFFQFTNPQKSGDIQLHSGIVAPWFDQPGGGRKYFCREKAYDLTIEELLQKHIIECMEFVDINELTLEIVTDRSKYYFLSSPPLEFVDAWPALGGKMIPVSLAWELGFLLIARRI